MDELRDFLDTVTEHGLAVDRFRGLLFVLIGQRIQKADGTPVSAGMNWRPLRASLSNIAGIGRRFARLGIDPSELAPRDREKYWYPAISGPTWAHPRREPARGDRPGTCPSGVHHRSDRRVSEAELARNARMIKSRHAAHESRCRD